MLAVNVAQCLSASGKHDWEAFVRTGALVEHTRPEVPWTPEYEAAIKKHLAIRERLRRGEKN